MSLRVELVLLFSKSPTPSWIMSSISSTCQQEALAHLQELLTSSDTSYSWCEINTNLESLLYWFNSKYSWAQSVWFNELVWSTDSINYGPKVIFNIQQLLFITCSILANIVVLMYHYTHSAHPKYSFSWLSRLCIRLHIIAGSIGVIVPIYVFFTTHVLTARICMYIFVISDFVFALTASYQTPNVYGVRTITIPLYSVCILFKFIINACLLQSLLIADPLGGFKEQVTWLWMCWVVHQTYAWVRVWYRIFIWVDAVVDHQYTVAVFMAGTMCIGGTFGFLLFFLWMIAMIGNFALLSYQVSKLEKEAETHEQGLSDDDIARKAKVLAFMWKEAQFNVFRRRPECAVMALKSCREHGINLLHPDAVNQTPSSLKAKILFETVDIDKSGEITLDELEEFLMSFGVLSVTQRAMEMAREADTDKSGTISLDEFEKSFASFYNYAFEGLIGWIHTANESNCRNKLEKLANVDRLLRVNSKEESLVIKDIDMVII